MQRSYHSALCSITLLYSQLDKIHAQKKMIHGGLQPRHIVLTGSSWQLLDMGLSCHINKPFKRTVDSSKPPSPAFCPPEMARVLLKATSGKTFDVTKLKEYSKARYDHSDLRSYLSVHPPDKISLCQFAHCLLTHSVAYDLWSIGCVLYELLFGAPLWRCTLDGSLVETSDLERLAAWTQDDVDACVALAQSGSVERLAAIDLLRKLLEPEEAARLAHFSAQREREMSGVIKHPFLTADAAAMGSSAAAADAAAVAAAASKAERKRRKEEEDAANQIELETRGKRISELNDQVAELGSRASELEASLQASSAALQSTQKALAPARHKLASLEQRHAAMFAEREHVVGMLRAQIEKDVAEADGMFGGAAKERMALVQTFLDAFETTLPEMGVFDEIKHASLGVVVVDPAVQVLKAKPSAADGAAAGRPTLSPAAQPKAAPSGSTAEERHLNELTEQLEAMESKLQALEGKDKSNVDALAAKERRIAELEARLADLELQKPGARNGESPAATRENTVKKSKRAKEKASSLPLKSPKDESKEGKDTGAAADSQRNSGRASARGRQEKKLSMAERMAMFN